MAFLNPRGGSSSQAQGLSTESSCSEHRLRGTVVEADGPCFSLQHAPQKTSAGWARRSEGQRTNQGAWRCRQKRGQLWGHQSVAVFGVSLFLLQTSLQGSESRGRQRRFGEGRQQGTTPQVPLSPGRPSLAVRSLPWPFGIPEAQSSHSLTPTAEKPAPPYPGAQPSRGRRWWDRSGERWALGLRPQAWTLSKSP